MELIGLNAIEGKNWLTALLDGTVEKEMLFSLLEASFELTKGRVVSP